MKTGSSIAVFAATLMALGCLEAVAGRGGGGGGGGGHGGSFGGGGFSAGGAGMRGPSINHTPSFSTPRPSPGMSHPSYSPSRQADLGGNRSALTPGTRPNINRPNIDHRPNIDNRGNIGNHTDIGNHTNIGNRFVDIHGNQINVNRPNYGGWYHGNWHDHWNHPWNIRPAWWGPGFAFGIVPVIPWRWGYWNYYNPYWVAPPVVENVVIDYSQPIVMEATPAAPPGAGGGAVAADRPSAEDQAMQLLDAARDAFGQGDYRAALAQADKAVARLPNDAVLHEFRALALFALGRYQEAAAALYAVLSVGPGWDWTTLSSLYPDADVYTEQLRALETFRNGHPNSADARFVLAYQYLTCGHTEAAAKELKAIVQLKPDDQLSAQLLRTLSTPESGEGPKPSEPAAPAQPVTASSLVGTWQARRPDGSAIALTLGGDSKFTWKFTQQDKPQEFAGTYSVADNLLILKQGSNVAMAGQVTPLGDGGFNFRLAGDNPSDPGLTFAK